VKKKPPKPNTLTLRHNGTISSAKGLRRDLYHDLYHFLISLTWPRFLLLLSAGFFLTNLAFGTAYYLLPLSEFDGLAQGGSVPLFFQSFFFSVQTFATIGYGKVSPVGMFSNLIVTFEAFVGLVSVAVGTGLVFARFARPRARVLFSRNILFTKHDGQQCLMFRISNERRNQIVDASVGISFILNGVTQEGESFRKIHDLLLRRKRSPVFALTWSVFHDITESSPLFGMHHKEMEKRSAMFAVSLSGIDETLSQTIHARHTYCPEAFVWNRKFVDILFPGDNGDAIIDIGKFHDTESLPA
jgi:inward rectifier potassium channel